MHDGAIDELVCIPLLASMQPQVDLKGIWITPADCLRFPTAIACQKILAFLGNPNVAMWTTDSSSPRPFPWEYRQYAMMVNLLPLLNQVSVIERARQIPVVHASSQSRKGASVSQAFSHMLNSRKDLADQQITFLVTCPFTDLATLLADIPALKNKIGSIVWMGGSINAGGNIDTGIAPGANPNAEWNAYWDPFATQAVFASGIPIYMFPLDVTNQAFLTPAILQQYFLPNSSNPVMNLVAQMYALVAFQGGYSFWDTLTAAYIGNPGLFTFAAQNLSISVEESAADFGAITVDPNGYPINVCQTVNVNAFYNYLAQQLMSLNPA